ncbi:MAG: histidine ammonia-lyase [Phycisphaerales bacterium]
MPSSKPAAIVLNADALDVASVVAVARTSASVRVGTKAIAAMKASRRVVEASLTDGQPHYGINTGFGSLAKQRISPADLRTLQRNLIRSHSAGVCGPLRPELVRAMMLILAASLARGLSGVRPIIVQTIVDCLNAGITPVVPSIGSVGASGDLAPLSHIALALIGEGEAWQSANDPERRRAQRGPGASPGFVAARVPSAAALRKAGIKPLVLEAKEGLALINGTHLMCAEGALLAHDADRLVDASIAALAMSIDGCRASHGFLDFRLSAARNHGGPTVVAGCVRVMLAGSAIVMSHVENDPRVQDPYSLRAGPTVLGAVYAALVNVEYQITAELGAVTDNPLVFGRTGRPPHRSADEATAPSIVSGANFHGMPLALPLDHLAIALCHLAGISERRTYLMTGAFEPESHLKPFLAPRPGLQSGLMIAQYTAAACVNEMIGLATPASVANLSTCAGMEDYNSFGPRSAAKARRSLELAEHVVAIELLCAAQALEHHRPLKSGRGVERAHATIREVVPRLEDDRPLTPDIEAIVGLIRAGAFRS